MDLKWTGSGLEVDCKWTGSGPEVDWMYITTVLSTFFCITDVNVSGYHWKHSRNLSTASLASTDSLSRALISCQIWLGRKYVINTTSKKLKSHCDTTRE